MKNPRRNDDRAQKELQRVVEKLETQTEVVVARRVRQVLRPRGLSMRPLRRVSGENPAPECWPR